MTAISISVITSISVYDQYGFSRLSSSASCSISSSPLLYFSASIMFSSQPSKKSSIFLLIRIPLSAMASEKPFSSDALNTDRSGPNASKYNSAHGLSYAVHESEIKQFSPFTSGHSPMARNNIFLARCNCPALISNSMYILQIIGLFLVLRPLPFSKY